MKYIGGSWQWLGPKIGEIDLGNWDKKLREPIRIMEEEIREEKEEKETLIPYDLGEDYYTKNDIVKAKNKVKRLYANSISFNKETKNTIVDILDNFIEVINSLKWIPIYKIPEIEEGRLFELYDCLETGISPYTFILRKDGLINIFREDFISDGSAFPTSFERLMNESGYTHWRYKVE